jgi:hypothetical protein
MMPPEQGAQQQCKRIFLSLLGNVKRLFMSGFFDRLRDMVNDVGRDHG